MPLIEHMSDANLDRLALERVVPALRELGFFYLDNFLGDLVGDIVLEQVEHMHNSGSLQEGRLVERPPGAGTPPGTVSGSGSSLPVQQQQQQPPGVPGRNVRGDKIAWVNGSERGCEAISYLLTLMDKLISKCGGRLGKSVIRERSKAMVACYPGNGAGYVKHVDNPNSDGRCVTCIYYLNKHWNTKVHGGTLRIFPDGKPYIADIEPLFDRLLLFWSDRRNPHEVQPSYATRYAVTVWYFDSEERAEAKERFRKLTASTQKQEASST